MSRQARTPGEAPDVEPLDVDGVRTVALFTVLWGVAFVALAVQRATLEANGAGWWLWTCLAGVGLGLLGLEYTRKRRDAIERARLLAEADDDVDDVGDSDPGATAGPVDDSHGPAVSPSEPLPVRHVGSSSPEPRASAPEAVTRPIDPAAQSPRPAVSPQSTARNVQQTGPSSRAGQPPPRRTARRLPSVTPEPAEPVAMDPPARSAGEPPAAEPGSEPGSGLPRVADQADMAQVQDLSSYQPRRSRASARPSSDPADDDAPLIDNLATDRDARAGSDSASDGASDDEYFYRGRRRRPDSA